MKRKKMAKEQNRILMIKTKMGVKLMAKKKKKSQKKKAK